MTKNTALGASFFLGPYDLSSDVGSVAGINASRAIIDVSPINVTGFERLLGRADGSISFGAFYNPSAGQSHPALNQIGTAAGTAYTIVSLFEKSTLGDEAVSLVAEQVSYNSVVGQDLSIGLTVDAQTTQGKGVEYGRMLTTAKQTFSSSGTAASIDGAAASSFGAAAYLHVFSIASGTATVAVQDSSDNSSFSNVTGLAFTAKSAAGFERVATAGTATIARYRRINITGTFTNLVCAVNLVVYPTSQT